MLCRRIIPSLEVAGGRIVVTDKRQDPRDIADPVDLALHHQQHGADELMLVSISASGEGWESLLGVVQRVARNLSIPFTVAVEISSVDQAQELLSRGADKICLSSYAAEQPDLVAEIAGQCGSQCCVVAIDARAAGNGWEVLADGGRRATGLDALDWARRATELGAGEILLSSWSHDGAMSDFDLRLTGAVSSILPIPVIASGAVFGSQSFVEVFQEGRADAALASTSLHGESLIVSELKAAILDQAPDIPMRYPC